MVERRRNMRPMDIASLITVTENGSLYSLLYVTQF
jgi:hypothetical protein